MKLTDQRGTTTSTSCWSGLYRPRAAVKRRLIRRRRVPTRPAPCRRRRRHLASPTTHWPPSAFISRRAASTPSYPCRSPTAGGRRRRFIPSPGEFHDLINRLMPSTCCIKHCPVWWCWTSATYQFARVNSWPLSTWIKYLMTAAHE